MDVPTLRRRGYDGAALTDPCRRKSEPPQCERIGASVADNQNKVTIAGEMVNGSIDVALLRPALRANGIGLGQDLGEQAPGYPSHSAMNFTGSAPPNTAWLSVCDEASYGDVNVCADMLDSEINGDSAVGLQRSSRTVAGKRLLPAPAMPRGPTRCGSGYWIRAPAW